MAVCHKLTGLSPTITHTQSENIKASGVCKIDHGCLCLLPVAALKSVELVTIQLNVAKKGQELRVRLYNSLSSMSALLKTVFPECMLYEEFSWETLV